MTVSRAAWPLASEKPGRAGRRILVAGRGGVAQRVISACRRLGLVSIAVVAETDPNPCHAAMANEFMPLSGSSPSSTYERVSAIVAAARRAQAHFVHPGSGALAEDPELVSRLAEEGVATVGPSSAALDVARDKLKTVARAHDLGIPTLPHATMAADLESLVVRIGFPIIIKPRSGCLGDGHKVIRKSSQLANALASFVGDTGWYAERYVESATVVAVTIARDASGVVWHLGDRETLLGRDSRKLLDASPVLTIPECLVRDMRRQTCSLASSLDVSGLVTCEFIVEGDASGYYFLEMNPRLSGGYRMCQAQTGTDVAGLQLSIAMGGRFTGSRPSVDTAIHCLEARWYRSPGQNSKLTFRRWRLPEVPHVTVDCAVRQRAILDYDVLLAQLLAIGPTRRVAAQRLIHATHSGEWAGGPRHYGSDIAQWLLAVHGCSDARTRPQQA